MLPLQPWVSHYPGGVPGLKKPRPLAGLGVLGGLAGLSAARSCYLPVLWARRHLEGPCWCLSGWLPLAVCGSPESFRRALPAAGLPSQAPQPAGVAAPRKKSWC